MVPMALLHIVTIEILPGQHTGCDPTKRCRFPRFQNVNWIMFTENIYLKLTSSKFSAFCSIAFGVATRENRLFHSDLADVGAILRRDWGGAP